jgi:futalosine hydrolase
MNCLVVSATTFEIRPFLSACTLQKQEGDFLSRYVFRNFTLDVLIPGVGIMLTAFHLGRQLTAQHYDFAINAGIAGTFNKNIPMGTVVNVTEDCISELGAEDGTNFLSVFELGLMDPDTFPYRNGKLVNTNIRGWGMGDGRSEMGKQGVERFLKIAEKLPQVSGITVNTAHGSIEGVERVIKQFNADIESMEGAAFIYACQASHIPCLQIRAISNHVEERNKSKWDMDLALKNLNFFLIGLFNAKQ